MKFSRLRPMEWFKRLQDVDFSNTNAATRLRNDLIFGAALNMILAVDKEYVFFIHPDPTAFDAEAKTPPQDVKIHPAFISLSVSKGKSTKSSFPTFVLPIGPLRRKPRTSLADTRLLSQPCDDPLSTQSRKDLLNNIERARDFEETNYFLVIDAISPEHPVWLIYDRNSFNMVGEMEPVNPSKQPIVFPEIKVNFDAAMILPMAKEWATSYSEDLEFGRFIDAINKTKIKGAVTAAYAALLDVENAFMKAEKKKLVRLYYFSLYISASCSFLLNTYEGSKPYGHVLYVIEDNPHCEDLFVSDRLLLQVIYRWKLTMHQDAKTRRSTPPIREQHRSEPRVIQRLSKYMRNWLRSE